MKHRIFKYLAFAALLPILLPSSADAQLGYRWANFAGLPGFSGSGDGSGTAARFLSPVGVAVDGTGNLYIADSENHTIRKVTTAGVVTTLAGSPGESGNNDGTGTAARFSSPRGVAVDGSGNVYVADSENNTIRKVSPAGVVTTLAGSGDYGAEDGAGTAASFAYPVGVAVDGSGNVFVADVWNSKIRKITSGGVVSTYAGSGDFGSDDGIGEAASFNSPHGVAVDGSGNVYVADTDNHTIRKISALGEVSTLAGLAGNSGSEDGDGETTRFAWPQGVSVDSSGNVYVADVGNETIRKVTSTGLTSTLAGSAGERGSSDGSGSVARFARPQGVAVDVSGNVYVADSENDAIRKVTSVGSVTTLAGATASGTANGTGSSARFSTPLGVGTDGAGNVYVADTGNHTIRKITPAGVVTIFAGTPGEAGSEDGTGANARFWRPEGIAVDGAGNVYVADTGNLIIRKVSPGGVVTTLAGAPGEFGGDNGTGDAARFGWPRGIAVDIAGNVYVADSGNWAIRKITPEGVVTTLDNYFEYPAGVAVDGAGNIYVTDSDAGTLHKVTPAGVETVLAGEYYDWGSNDGIGSEARFRIPMGVAVDGEGNVFVADFGNKIIRKVTPVGVVSTIGGIALMSGNRDGAISAARFRGPSGIAVGPGGALFVTDERNHRISKATLGVVPPSVMTGPTSGVTTNSATTEGEVIADGGGTVTERGVVHSTSPNPTLETGTKVASGGGMGSYIANLVGLSHTTTYYVRAYATNSEGTGYGTQVSFTTQTPGAVAPSVTTTPASDVTTNSAATGGNVTSTGGAAVTERGIVFSTAPNPTIETGISTSSGSGTGSFDVELSGLSQDTTYYVRAYALNTSGTGYGEQVSFTTQAITATPIFNNVPVTDLAGATGSTVYYVISVPAGLELLTFQISGGTGDCDLYIRQADFPTLTEWDYRPYEGGNDETVEIEDPESGTYFIMLRGYEAFSGVTLLAYHDAVGAAPPSVTTSSVTGVTSNSATAGGNVIADGGASVTERGVVYATQPNPTMESGTKVISGSGTGSFTASLSGLAASTTHYVRAYAINSAGTAYGTQVSFVTEAPPVEVPVVTTSLAGDVTSNSATAGGEVTADGGAAVTERGVVYATQPNPTIESGTKVTSGSGTGSFTADLSGLAAATVHYVRAYAINSAGTAYGTQVTFESLSLPLGDSLNGVGLTWSVSGSAPWRGQNTVTSDGVSAAASGHIGNSEQTWIETSVTGPGTVTFRWKVSSEEGKDILRFLRSGEEQFSISGEVDWEEKTAAVPAGTHTLRWIYHKDASGAAGSDRAWLDRVQFTATPPVVPARIVVGRPRAFPATTVGRKSRPQAIRVSNGGGSPLSGLRVAAGGPAKRDYLVVQPASKTLAPGAATTFRATFRPRSKGTRRATFTVSGNVRAVSVSVTGRGVAKKK